MARWLVARFPGGEMTGNLAYNVREKIISRPRNFEGEVIKDNKFSQRSTGLNFSRYLILSSKF